MYTRVIHALRRRDWLRLAYETSFGLAACSLSATAGFLADRGPGRGLDPSSPVQIAAAAAAVVLAVAGLTLYGIKTWRGMITQAGEQAAKAELATPVSVGRRGGSSAPNFRLVPPPSSAPTSGSTSALPAAVSTASRAG